VPGGSPFYERYTGVRLSASLPSAPFRILGHEVDDDPIGSLEEGLLLASFDTRPTSLTWTADDSLDARYAMSVPAGGAGSVRQATAVGVTESHASVAAAALDDGWSAPQVTIAGPQAGATLSAGNVRVTGTASDMSGPPIVTVNGVTARVEADGFWSAEVPAAAGALPLTAVASDTATSGGSSRASRARARTGSRSGRSAAPARTA
jgi:hypothetical protein